jgi:hypothetical protein
LLATHHRRRSAAGRCAVKNPTFGFSVSGFVLWGAAADRFIHAKAAFITEWHIFCIAYGELIFAWALADVRACPRRTTRC